MAIQVWTPYTADQSTLAGGQALAAGIGGGLNSLGDALQKALDKKKQRNLQAKASEQLFKSTPELQQSLGMDPEDFAALSADEKTELVKTGIGKISLMQSLQAQKAQAEQMEMRQMQSAAESQSIADSLGFNREVAGMAQAETGQPVDLQQVLGAGARHNQLGNPQFDNLLNSLQRGQESQSLFKADELGRIRPTEYPGVGFAPTSKGGGQIVYDPTIPNRPPGARPGDEGTIEIPDPDDPVYGPRIRIPVSVARKEFPHLLKSIDKGKAPSAEDATGAKELQQANEAIAAGVDRKKVAAKYKERTGKDLP